jgi:hypothetical protein
MVQKNWYNVADICGPNATGQLPIFWSRRMTGRTAAHKSIGILSIISTVWSPAMREVAGNRFVQFGLSGWRTTVTGEDYFAKAAEMLDRAVKSTNSMVQ